MDKLYVICRRDLSPGDQAVQLGHAAMEFMMEHHMEAAKWFVSSNHLAYLSVPDEKGLLTMLRLARDKGLKYSIFREEDLDNTITAIALEPGDRSGRICRGLPLALKELSKK